MDDEAEDTPSISSKTSGYGWLWWVGLALVLYILSTGPFLMMVDKNIIRPGSAAEQVMVIVYAPVEWVSQDTPLEKPLGIYWHLWAPKLYDSKGNFK
jgi:hypothetical protein